MEFFEELLLTVIISALLAFLLARIAPERPESPSAPAGSGARLHAALDPIQEEAEVDDEDTPAATSYADPLRVPDFQEESKIVARLGEDDGTELRDALLEGVEGTGRIGVGLEERHAEETADVVLGSSTGDVAVGKQDVAGVDKGESLLQGEDEWEGIERSEVGKLFGVATEFVCGEKGGDAVSKLSSEVQMQLYGLHKVATEGPCHEPQPMALMVSARARWHAWQRLGSMNPEAAMEQYISLLTKYTPEWMIAKHGVEAKDHDGNDSPQLEVYKMGQNDSKSSQAKSKTENLAEESSSIEGINSNVETRPNLFKQGLTKMFLFNMISPTKMTF